MRIHVLQHVPFEGLGSIQQWVDAQEASLTWTHFFAAAHLPDLSEIDLLIVLGGPMSVNDEGDFPWLVEEKRFVAAAIAAGKPVLGICLGAQLIARAMGARVYPNPIKEIGWFEIESAASDPNCFRFPPAVSVYHWHGETFDLPEGAHLLAQSQVCRNQAFQIGDRVMGLQFHLETTPETAESMLLHCSHELVEGECIQTAEEMRMIPGENYERINNLMTSVLDYITR